MEPPSVSAAPGKPAHLEPSELGNKDYWDRLYAAELSNHAANPSDTGTVWFDDSDAEAKLLEFLDAACGPAPERDLGLRLDRETTSFLDLGCGNGSLLRELRREGWRGRCVGVDYSAASVRLTRRITEAEGGKEEEGGMEFAEWDVLRGEVEELHALSASEEKGYDVLLDKGTFDAVSLSGEKDRGGRRVSEGYRARVLKLLRSGGCFLLTSCNWTEEELKGWFEEVDEDGGRLVQVGRIEYPSFSFGGVKGQTISTLCFVKKV